MNKSEFIDAVAEKAELTRAAAARVVDAIFDTASGAISEAVHAAGSLSIPGFGKFTRRTRAARSGRNPRTGTGIKIPERTTVGFSAGRGLKEKRSTSRRKNPLATAAGTAAGAAGGAAAARRATSGGSSASSRASGTFRTIKQSPTTGGLDHTRVREAVKSARSGGSAL